MSDEADVESNDTSKHIDVETYKSSPPSDNPSGATIVTANARRRVSAYPVFENEIRSISTFNSLSIACFSIMSAFVSFAVGIWINAFFIENPPPEGRVLSHVGAPASCVVAVNAAGLGIWAIRPRSNAWKDIRRESGGQG
jgi:hypothetical protein